MITDRPNHEHYPEWWRQHGPERIAVYTSEERSFISGLLPEEAIKMSGVELMQILYQRLGGELLQSILANNVVMPSPARQKTDGSWIKHSRTVGINVRTIGNFYNVVKYALTLPAHIDCIHLLPIWEAGVVASLYGMASRRINPEFFSTELVVQFPQFNTVEKQLKLTIDFLHALGKKVGMDVIPHTDRYSEIVLANPDFFEWLHRDGLRITDHSLGVAGQAEMAILGWLRMNGPATAGDISNIWPLLSQERFFRELEENARLEILFGKANNSDGRRERRISLVDHLYRLGLEPVPATMAPPYRGLKVDDAPDALTIDEAGREWRDYRIIHPQEMSRVFGPLARFRLYGRKDNNANWEIDFDAPRSEVFEYVNLFYAEQQAKFGFDFMRGDMSHVQMRPGGVPSDPHPDYYDLLASVKRHIQQSTPYFAYFAESFLAPDNYMAYGNEVDHLEASLAEVTLGNLQSFATDEVGFHAELRRYLDIAATRQVAPAFSIITGDKDDPRFDKFYLHGNVARLFFGLFMPDLPAYYSLGFEQRDIHPYPAPNEFYTKLYVFQLSEGPKATNGPYRWGRNTDQFFLFDRLHCYFEAIKSQLSGHPVNWLIYPDATGQRQYCAWQINKHIFVVNFGRQSAFQLRIPINLVDGYRAIWTTKVAVPEVKLEVSDQYLTVEQLGAGEGIIITL
ncbi:hypothetical protein CEQ90_13980 [Lewinellaceae bacterium SD302]|nr:hypothetical protein CEQ90_13980 [Lewinellaceae bacterium SD302]